MAYRPIPLSIPPGIVAQPTNKVPSAFWRDANLVRWVDGKLTPVGGWSRVPYAAFGSKCRAIHRWTTNGGISMVAYLCESNLYVDQGDGTLTDITPVDGIEPPDATIVAGGYGDDLYGDGDYGTARPDKTDPNKRITPGYYLDNWGEDLLAMTGTDGRLLRWKPSSPSDLAEAVPNAPVSNRGFVVATQRHVVLFGAGGTMNQYAWCDEEDIEDWNFDDITSKAGWQTVQPASPIIACSRSGNDIVFFTEAGHAYYLEYVGMPYIFGGDRFASGVTPISPMSIVDGPEGAIWVAEGGVWSYSARQAINIPCALWQWFVDQGDPYYTRYTGSMMVNPMMSEMWYFFSSGQDGIKNDRVMIYNYKDRWWSSAYISRAAGANGTYTGLPLMTDGKYVYEHESGNYYSGDNLPWVETFPMAMDSGASLSTLLKIMPDVSGGDNRLSYEVNYNISRIQDQIVDTGDRRVQKDGCVYFDATGRDFRLRIKQNRNGVPPWTLGDLLVYVTPRGVR